VEFLSEDTVKRATLQFMKTHYKHYARHPERGETLVSFDKSTPDGLLIDGALEFTKDDGQHFLATFEATSVASSGEVRYTLQRNQLTWDTGAAAAAVSMLAMIFFSRTVTFSFNSLGIVGSFLLWVVTMLLAWIVCNSILKSMSRYRYIYGIEQFKKYNADNQWIALSRDVFADPNDPYFLELKQQCVKNGFGLLTVNRSEQIHLVLTPARDKILRNRPDVWAKASNQLQRFEDLMRFQRRQPYLWQKGLAFFSLILTCLLFYREKQASPVVYAPSNIQEILVARADTMRAEPAVYPNEAEQLGINKNASPYPLENPESPKMPNSIDEASVGMVIASPEGLQEYPCGRVYTNLKGTTYYAIYFRIENSYREGMERVRDLNNLGLKTNLLNLHCFNPNLKQKYLIYFEELFSSQSAANQSALKVIETMKNKNLIRGANEIRLYVLEGK
jgi:hypothetical protein